MVFYTIIREKAGWLCKALTGKLECGMFRVNAYAFLIASIISSKCSDQGPAGLLVLNLGFTPKKIGYRCAACFSEPLHYLRPMWSSDQLPCLL